MNMYDESTNTLIYYTCDHLIKIDGEYVKVGETNHTTWNNALAEGKKWNSENENHDHYIYEIEVDFND